MVFVGGLGVGLVYELIAKIESQKRDTKTLVAELEPQKRGTNTLYVRKGHGVTGAGRRLRAGNPASKTLVARDCVSGAYAACACFTFSRAL